MENGRENRTAHHRSLPTIPQIYRKLTAFPATHRDAEDWLATIRPTIDRAVQIIERYPDLKKENSCEKLNEFGKRKASKGRNGENRSTIKTKDKTRTVAEVGDDNQIHKPQTDAEDSGLSVPEILVSQADDDEFQFVGNQPRRVYVCGYVDNDLWHRLLVDLCKKYSIRCMAPTDYPECNRWLSEADVFLFLMDDTSVKEYPYQDQLRMAVVLDLNIVYVRDLGFELKIDQTSRKNPKKSETLRAHSQNKVPLCTEFPSSSNLLHPNLPFERMSCLPLDSAETGEEELLPRDLHGIVSPPPNRHIKSPDVKGGKLQSHFRPEIDVAKITEKEYGTALVYHHLYHSRCLDRIISAINSQEVNLMGRSTSVTNSRHSLLTPFSTYSMYSGSSNDSAVGDMYHRMTPEPSDAEVVVELDQSFEENSNQSELSLTETIYLVCPAVGDTKPKVFHWPEDVKKEIITNSPSIDSFGFQDIDLSKRINELDLFEADFSD